MKSNFLKNKIQLGEIKYNQFALNIYKQNNAIQLGFISNDNIWNGYTENQNKRYIGQCLNEFKSGASKVSRYPSERRCIHVPGKGMAAHQSAFMYFFLQVDPDQWSRVQ